MSGYLFRLLIIDVLLCLIMFSLARFFFWVEDPGVIRAVGVLLYTSRYGHILFLNVPLAIFVYYFLVWLRVKSEPAGMGISIAYVLLSLLNAALLYYACWVIFFHVYPSVQPG